MHSKKQRSLSKKQSGFTMVELMIAVTVVIILSSIVAIGASSFLSLYRVKAATRDVVSLIHLARNQAANTHRMYRVWVCVKGTACPQLGSSGNGGLVLEQGLSSSAHRSFPEFHTGLSLANMEKKTYNLDDMYPGVIIENIHTRTSRKNKPLDIYFKPDGQVVQCYRSGTNIVCNPTEIFICLKGDPSLSKGPESRVREIHIRYNGIIRVNKKSPVFCQ